MKGKAKKGKAVAASHYLDLYLISPKSRKAIESIRRKNPTPKPRRKA